MKSLVDYINEGISGYDWIDSDGCSDMLARIFKDFNKVVKEEISHMYDYSTDTLTSFDVMNALLNIFDMYKHGGHEYFITEDLWNILDGCWNQCMNDKKFIEEWKDSEELVKALKTKRKEIDKYKDIITDK